MYFHPLEIEALDSQKNAPIDVIIPRFRAEFGAESLKPALMEKLGIIDVFGGQENESEDENRDDTTFFVVFAVETIG